MRDEQIVKELINSPVIGICIYQEKKGKIVYINDYFSKLIGYKRDELLTDLTQKGTLTANH